jgi:hypothetical protein
MWLSGRSAKAGQAAFGSFRIRQSAASPAPLFWLHASKKRHQETAMKLIDIAIRKLEARLIRKLERHEAKQ